MSFGFLPKPRIERLAGDVYAAAVEAGMSPEPPVNVEFIVEFVLNYDLHLGASLPAGVLGSTDGHAKVVYISDEFPNEGRRRFTIAHEIGHIQMHVPMLVARDKQPTLFDFPPGPHQDDSLEWQADYFASALLMPRQLLVKHFGEAARLGQAIKPAEVADFFDVSRQAASIRLEEVGMIHRASPGVRIVHQLC